MNVEQAIAALKTAQARTARGMCCLDADDYHSILALLEGMRWRKVSEPPENEWAEVLVGWSRGEWNPSYVTVETFARVKDSFQSDDLWLPLPSPPTE